MPLDQMFDFIEEYPKIFTGFEVITEFERSSNESMLYTDRNNEFKVEFKDLSFMLAHIQLKNSSHKLYDELCLSNEPIK